MVFAGIDVGAQSVKIVILKNGKIAHARVVVTEEEGGLPRNVLSLMRWTIWDYPVKKSLMS